MTRSILPRVSPPNYQWCRAQVFFITWLAYVGFYLTRKAFAVAKIELQKEEVWGITKATMGKVDLAYLVAYAIGQFIWGITADRVGTRRVVLTGMLVSIVMAVIAGASTITVLLGVVLFIQGLAQSTGWAPLTKNIGSFFSRQQRGRMMGFWCSNYAVGGIIASALAGYSIEWMGQERLAEYQTELQPTIAHVKNVAADQGFNEEMADNIFGHLLIAQAAKLPPGTISDTAVKQQLQTTRAACRTFVRDKQLSPPIQAAALQALFKLRDPEFDSALVVALRSKNEILYKSGEEFAKQAFTSGVPVLRESAIKALQEVDLTNRSEFKMEARGESPNVTHHKPSSFDPQKILNSIHQDSTQTIWGMVAWRYAFWIPAATLLLIWVLFILLQRDKPTDFSVAVPDSVNALAEPVAGLDATSGETEISPPTISPYRNPVVLHLAAVYFFLKPTRYMILFWSPLYLNERLGTGTAESGFLSGMFELAGPLGVICGGFLSDVVFRSRRMPVCVIFFFLLSILLFLFNGLPANRIALGMGLLGIGFLLFAPDSLISGTAAIDFGTQKGSGAAAGLINGVGSIGAALGGYLPALLTSDDNVTDWNLVFRILAGFVLAAGLLLIPLWNAVPKEAARSETIDDSNEPSSE